jgi:hypothetical protein
MIGPYPGDGAADGARWYPGRVMDRGAPKLRHPPHDLEAERGLLGSILRHEDMLDEATEGLEPEHFYRDDHQTIYGALRALADAGRPVDAIALGDELRRRGVWEAIGEDEALSVILERASTPFAAADYARTIREKAAGRRVQELGEELARKAAGGGRTAEELFRLGYDGLARAEAILPRPYGEGGLAAEPRGYPRPVGDAAFHGLAGEFVRMVEPHTESDPLAILYQFLTMFGSVIGRRAHWVIEATTHRLNLFTCIVGVSSQGRKGTSLGHCRRLFGEIDPDWYRRCVRGGLTSGEGMIDVIKDPVSKEEKQKDGTYRWIEVERGVADKRCLWLESEFGGVLDVARREGNNLSAKLRIAWDGDTLSSSSKANPIYATDPHVSIIGHITFHELLKKLGESDLANGFTNRFLWVCVRRSQHLPHGGRLHTVDFSGFKDRLRDAVSFGRDDDFDDVPLCRDAEADALWEERYPGLTAARPGVLGQVAGRASAQVMRLAALYAVLDCSPWICRAHLEAGLALWKYCEDSAAYIFGDLAVNEHEAKVLAAIRAAGPEGLTATQVNRKVYSGHRKADDLNRTLLALQREGLIVAHQAEATARKNHKPAVLWVAAAAPGGG